MQAINPINTHTKFGKDRINTFPSNERKPSVRMTDGRKSKNKMSTPKWGGHKNSIRDARTPQPREIFEHHEI